MDNEENFERYDFTIEEMSSGAKWVKDAKKYHDEKARQEPVEDIFARVRSNSAAGAKIVELTPAEEEKEKGQYQSLDVMKENFKVYFSFPFHTQNSKYLMNSEKAVTVSHQLFKCVKELGESTFLRCSSH